MKYLTLSVALTLCACAGGAITNRRGDVTGKSFEFQGGNEGEWNLRSRGDALWIAREKPNGEVEDFGSRRLTDHEAARLWDLIERAEIPKRKSSTRKANDDEEQLYMFWVAPKESGLRDVKVPIVEMWADDVYEDEDLAKLVHYLGKLIEKYTKKNSVL